MKRLLLFFLAVFPLVVSAQKTFDLDLPHNRSTTYTLDTLFFDHDSVYISNGGDTIKFVVDDVEGLRIVNTGSDSRVYIYGDLVLGDTLFFAYDSTYIVDDTDSMKFVVDESEGMRLVNTGSTSILYIYGDISVGDTLFFGNGEWMEGETDTEIHTNASFEPETDLSHDLGEPTKRWNGVYTNDNYVYNNEYLDDTLFFAYDSTYIVDDTDTLKFVVDDDEAMRIINEGTNASVNVYGDLDVSGVLDVDSAVSIGAWGYTGEHIVFSEASSNTNPLLGVFGEANFDVSAGKTIAGTYSRALASANQTNQSTIVGTESQFRLRNVNLADGMHAGLWAYAEQSGTSTLSGNGTFDAIDATVESESGFTVGATERVSGITIDASIHASASINASANYSGIFIKSNGKDWFDGLYITGATNDIKLKNGATINNGGANTLTITEPTIALVGNETLTGTLSVDSAVSIGAWGYTGEHIVFPEASSNTNAGLGVYSMLDYSATAGKVFAGTYSRALAMTTNQTNQSTIVGTESQFRLRDVDIADGVHAGLWAYAEQSGTSTLSGNGTFDAISACVESESGFTVGATEHVTGITIDASIHASASINASANYSGLYIKSNGKDWFDGIKITGCDNDIKLKNGATINNIRSGNLTITEDTVAVVGVLDVTGNAEVSGALTATGNITGATMVCLHTVATYVFSDLDSCKNVAHFNNDADAIDFTLPGAAAGLVVIFYDIGGGVITIDPVDGTDTIYLNGTSVGAGDAIDSPGDVGDFICLMAIDATRWVTVGRSGTWIDGGVD